VIEEALAPSEIYRILNGGGECLFAPRPDFLTNESPGHIFVERVSGQPGLQRIRRRKGVDQWKQGMELTQKRVHGVTCGKHMKGEVWVKSSYGTVVRAKPTGGSGITSLYHMHELLYFYNGKAAAEALAEQLAVKLAPKNGASTLAPKRKRQIRAPVAQPDFIVGTLFHLRGSTAKVATRTTTTPVQSTSSGKLKLRLDPDEKRWIQFIDERGETKGGVDLGSKGPRFSAASGDFAEYHRRDPTQQAFEEGDLVGFGPAGLTRTTKGSRQLGIISRQAIVVGSVPAESDLSEWDSVAYIGKVPVKLRGGAKRDDFLIPSGKEDGTVVATSGFPDTTIGRALHDYPVNDSVPEASLTWQLAEASVVPPVQSIRSDETKWQQILVVVICCSMTALVVAAEFAGRQLRTNGGLSAATHLATNGGLSAAMHLAPLLKLALILGCTGTVLRKFAGVHPRIAGWVCFQAARTWPCKLWPKVASTLLQCGNELQTGSTEKKRPSTRAQTGGTHGEAGGAISAMDQAAVLTAGLLLKSEDAQDDAEDAVLDEVLQQSIDQMGRRRALRKRND
jgi:hypothetical protein